MFDIGWGELLVIGIVALIAIGPKELPGVLRSLGQWMGKVRRMASEFQGQFQEAMREAEMAELKKQVRRHESSVSDAARSAIRISIRSDTQKEIESAFDEPSRNAELPTADVAGAVESVPEAAATAADIASPLPEPPPPVSATDLAAATKPPTAQAGRRAAHEQRRGRDRGHQGAVDGAPDRAALAADQGADRIRADVRALFLLRQADLQHPGLAVRVGRRRRRIRNSSTPRCSNISSPSSSSRCSARLFCLFPIVATQIYMFVAPGLYRHERQAFLPYLVATPVFFALGAMLVYFLVMPMLVRFSLGMQQTGGDGQAEIALLPKVGEYLSLMMTLIFAFGIAFQLPVILTLLGRDRHHHLAATARASAAISSSAPSCSRPC